MKRHALTDEQWELIRPLLPRRTARTGRLPRDERQMLDGIMWILATGAPWRDLPERFGPWNTVYDYFRNWRKAGVFASIVEVLQIKLDQQGYIDWDLWCVDGASVRATRAAGGAGKKASNATSTNRPTTLWAAQKAGLEPSSTFLLTAREFHWRSTSPPGKSASKSG
jgi:transposase